MGARGTEQVIAATLQRPAVLRIQVVHTTIVGATTDTYAMPSVLERAHDRMHAMLGTHETDPKMPIGLERLRRKITTTLGARAIRDVAILELHALNLRRGIPRSRSALVQGLGTLTIVALFPRPLDPSDLDTKE